MVTVYGTTVSGNCWKAAQILRLTGHELRWVETDGNSGATRTSEFLALNPNGKVPIVVLKDGSVITESGAILAHFAEGTCWLPSSGLPRTRVLEWLFFKQYSHEPCIAVARNIISFPRQAEANADRQAQCRVRGGHALDVTQRRLGRQEFLTDAGPTIADLALFAYTHVSDEGGFDLACWPDVQRWVGSVRALLGIVPLR